MWALSGVWFVCLQCDHSYPLARSVGLINRLWWLLYWLDQWWPGSMGRVSLKWQSGPFGLFLVNCQLLSSNDLDYLSLMTQTRRKRIGKLDNTQASQSRKAQWIQMTSEKVILENFESRRNNTEHTNELKLMSATPADSWRHWSGWRWITKQEIKYRWLERESWSKQYRDVNKVLMCSLGPWANRDCY